MMLAMSKDLIITTMNERIKNSFGQRMLDTFLKFWASDKKLVVYSEDEISFANNRLLVKTDFIDHGLIEQIKNVETDSHKLSHAIKHSYKVFALYNALCNSEGYDYLIYLDADTESIGPVRTNLAEFLTKDYLLAVHMDQVFCGSIQDHYETGLILLNLKHPKISVFRDNLLNRYIDCSVLDLPMPWDGFVIKDLCETHSLEVLNLSKNNSNEPFNNPEIKRCMVHHMGKLKYNEATV